MSDAAAADAPPPAWQQPHGAFGGYDAGGRSGSPTGATTTTTYGGQSPVPAGAHFNQHFDTISRALDSVGIPGGVYAQQQQQQQQGGLVYGGVPIGSPRAQDGWGAAYPAKESAYGKTVAVVAPNGQTEMFRIAVGESGDNIREAIRGAFALGPSCSFTLRDPQGCNVVLGFPSLADGSRYQIFATAQLPAGHGAMSPRAYAPPSSPVPQQQSPPPQYANGAAAAAGAHSAPGAAYADPSPLHPAAAYPHQPAPAAYVPARRRQRQTSWRPPAPGGGPGPKHGRHGRAAPMPRTRKALLVGINYVGMKEEIRTCNDDARRMASFIGERGFGSQDTGQHWTLTDDNDQGMPTKQNIMRGIDWLVEGAQPGDALFLHFSGHGAEFKDDEAADGGEEDGLFEEALLPADFKNKDHGGYRIIRDDEIVRQLVVRLPPGVRLTIVCDCCHSGTMVDLPYKLKAHKNGYIQASEEQEPPIFDGHVVMLSSVRAEQAGAETVSSNGALTAAFIAAVSQDNNPTYDGLMQEVLRGMQASPSGGERCHMPMLSSTHRLDGSDRFYLCVDG